MNNLIKRVWNRRGMTHIEDLQGFAFSNESGGHTFQISGVEDGTMVVLSGTVAASFLRPDQATVAITGSISGGVVSVTLPANCYDIPGRFGLVIFLTSDSQTTAIYSCVGNVARSSTSQVAPGTTADVVDLINQIQAAVATIPQSWSGLMADIAPTYSTSAVYPVGAYVYYNGDLYRCTTAITTAESWTAGHWTAAVLGNDLVDLKSVLSNSVANGTELGFVLGSLDNGVPNVTPYRIRSTFIPVKNGISIKYGGNPNCLNCVYYGENREYISTYGWTNNSLSVDSDDAAYIRIVLRADSTDTTNMTNNVDAYAALLNTYRTIPQNIYNFSYTDEDIENIADKRKRLLLGEFVNGHLVSSGVVDDNLSEYRISTPQIIAFPKGSNKKLTVKINPDYLAAIRCGATSTNLNNNLYWYKNGDVITIPNGDNYYAVSICNAAGNDIHNTVKILPSEDIGLEFLYDDDTDVIVGNIEPEKTLSNAKLFFSSSQRNMMNKYAVIGHTSDCHGDYQRVENFLTFCDHCKADIACVTGDIVSYKPSEGIKWFNDILLAHETIPAVCTGNHDVYDDNLTDADIYDFMFADIATKIGNTTGKTWYYTDIPSKLLRIISVNLYQYGGNNRWYSHFTSEQIEWLIATLSNTPNNYGILILSHAPQVSLTKDSNYGTFFQDVRLYNGTHNDITGGVPLYDIVDAFIGRTTLSKSYTQTGNPGTLTVTADFSGVDASVEFIAHLTGHFHQDSICYVPNMENMQLMLNVTCTNALYGGASYPYLAELQDQARNNLDASQDAFNMYVIDRDKKTVRVVRIGNTETYQMHDRKFMEIPYAI